MIARRLSLVLLLLGCTAFPALGADPEPVFSFPQKQITQGSLPPVFAEDVLPLFSVSVATPGEQRPASAGEDADPLEDFGPCASSGEGPWLKGLLRQAVIWLSGRDCAAAVPAPPTPAPAPAPRKVMFKVEFKDTGSSGRLFSMYAHEAADRYLQSFLRNSRGGFLRGVRRSGRYLPMIFRIFREEGVPEMLAYLPAVESNYNPRARSPARAMGLWQFMVTTARRYGLQVRYPWYDERLDPERSTRAAAQFLAYLHDRYGNWELALAAYNAGERRVNEAIRRARQEGLKPIYWNLQLPPQTRAYVPAFMALARLYRSPRSFGFTEPVRERPVRTEILVVDKASSLAEVAHRLNLSLPTLVQLNLAWRRGYIPGGLKHKVMLRVPTGLKKRLLASLKSNRPVTLPWLTHVVERKESLSQIARGYGVAMAEIMSVNPITNKNFLMIGQRLVIPPPPGTRGKGPAKGRALRGERAEYQPPPASIMHFHRVRKGETLLSVSRRYGVSTDDLQRWNVSLELPIRPLQRMVVYLPRQAPVKSVARISPSS